MSRNAEAVAVALGAIAAVVTLVVLTTALGAWALMLLVPALGAVGLPHLAPSFWQCFALLFLGRLVLGFLLPSRAPAKSGH